MKISNIRSQILVLPEADPLADTPENPNAARPIVIVRIDTDDGVEGIAVTFYGGAITAALKRAVDDLGALTIGDDPHRVEAIAAKLRPAAPAQRACSPWPYRRSTSRCGISAARRWASHCGNY